MDTGKRLREAKFFLGFLVACSTEREDLDFYLSAFLNAWRSVLDIMLYDFAEKFSLPFTRKEKIMASDFELVGRQDISKFIKWWKTKWNLLSKNPLWAMRNVTCHRGYPPRTTSTTIYLSGSGATSETVSFVMHPHFSNIHPSPREPVFHPPPSKEWYFEEIRDESGKKVCRLAYKKMAEIVKEAEEKFEVKL